MIKKLIIIWFILAIELLILSIFKGVIYDYESIGLLFVVSHLIVTFFLIHKYYTRFASLFASALLLRFLVMLWDIYGRSVFILPHSGLDTEFYFETSLKVSEDLGLVFSNIRGGMYPKMLGVLFYFIGPVRIIAQYINVLLGLMTVMIIHQTLRRLMVGENTIKTILIIAVFFPTSLIMSAVLLREILPTFLVAVSLLCFVNWYKSQSLFSFILSLVYLSVGSMFHSGVIGIGVGYLFMFLFYNHLTKKFEVKFQNMLMFIPVIAIIFLFTTQFGDLIFYKFRSLEDPADIYDNIQSAAGGSAYLKGMTINSPLQLVFYAPIREFYFLFSPLPMDWRGSIDIITFFTDSVFYFFVFYYAIHYRKYFIFNKQVVIGLIIALLIVSFIYGIGVSNAGTAIRHRQKIIPIFLVLLGVMMNEKERILIALKQAKIKKLLK